MAKTGSLLQVAFAIIVPLLAVPSLALSPTTFAACAGTGIAGGPNGGLMCSGDCNPGTCKQFEGQDAIGNYKYCRCSPGGTENPCCHLVARKSDPDKAPFDILDVRGLCTNTNPDCASVDGLICKLVSDQPVCQLPNPE